MKELTKKGKTINLIIALVLILIGVTLRFIPHAPNFAPIATIALFGGVYLSKRIALILPVLAMLVSDIFIGFYDPKLMISVYGSFLLFVALGFWLKSHKKWYTIAGGTVLSALLFFLITNFAVWAFSPWYTKNLLGIIQCYSMAIPFFRNTLLGNLFYTTIFFGSYELIHIWVSNRFGIKKSFAYA
ncbi:hypothetical protein KKC00_02440 [Patescibacteria group bacterium]|nr:hypothetical protein [Patescibacteria group bacterium]